MKYPFCVKDCEDNGVVGWTTNSLFASWCQKHCCCGVVGVSLFKFGVIGVLDADVDVEYNGVDICVDDDVDSIAFEFELLLLELRILLLLLFKSNWWMLGLSSTILDTKSLSDCNL